MVIKEIGFLNLETTVANIAAIDGTTSMCLSLINVYIWNNRVIKDLPLFAGGKLASINNINSFNSVTDSTKRYAALRLFTNIVIPPQVQFYVNVRTPFGVANGTNTSLSLRVYLKGYGKLFNPRNNY